MPDQATTKHAYRKPVNGPAEYLGIDLPGFEAEAEEFAGRVLDNPTLRFGDGDLLLVVQTFPNDAPTVWVFKVEARKPRLLTEAEH